MREGMETQRRGVPVLAMDKLVDRSTREKDMGAKSPVMSLRQAAAYLQVSKAHLSNVINGKVSGVPPVRSFRVGRRLLIKREWIDEWLESAHHETVRQC